MTRNTEADILSTCKALLRELRAEFLPASMVTVLLGASLAFHDTGSWNWSLFALCLSGVALLHSGANVLNDYFDHRSGNDACNREFARPFTGGSRLIQSGHLAPTSVLRLGVILLMAGLLAGVYLAMRAGSLVVLLGALGLAGGVLYSAPPVNLAARGLGEITVGVLFGILPVVGAYYVQTGGLRPAVFLVALPAALLIMAVLWINQFQDYEADRAVGKRNLVVRLGRKHSARIYAGLMAAWIAALAASIIAGAAPPALGVALLPGVAVPWMVSRAARDFDDGKALVPVNAATVAMHLAVGILMSVALICARLINI